MEALDDGFEEAVDAVGAGELEEGAEDLGGAEVGVAGWLRGVGWVGGRGGERGGVEVVDEGLEG